jgi:hypothetical protein
MPKLAAPHAASWRGRAIAFGEAVDVEELEAVALRAHGFRDAPTSGKSPLVPEPAPDLESLTRKQLLKLLRGKGAGNVFVMSNPELRAAAAKVLAPDTTHS